MKLLCTIILGVAVLAGCESAATTAARETNEQMEAKGSPFRYVTRDDSSMVLTLLPLPAGPSKAIPELQKQVLDNIAREETKNGRGTTLLEEVRHLQDGREVWVLQSLNAGVAYVVSFAAPTKANSSIRIKGPTTYAK